MRSALAAESYEEACRLSTAACGVKISRQSFALFEKIIEVDAYVGAKNIHEVHPEVSFRILNGGERLTHNKKSWGGLRTRLALLRKAGVDPDALVGEVDEVPIDDVVDAAVAAWSARRIARGDARSFPPEVVESDISGRGIRILA